MPARPVMFLVRGPDGRMHTIMATSAKDAAAKFVDKYRTRAGDLVSAKLREGGEWHDFKLKG